MEKSIYENIKNIQQIKNKLNNRLPLDSKGLLPLENSYHKCSFISKYWSQYSNIYKLNMILMHAVHQSYLPKVVIAYPTTSSSLSNSSNITLNEPL